MALLDAAGRARLAALRAAKDRAKDVANAHSRRALVVAAERTEQGFGTLWLAGVAAHRAEDQG